MNRLKYCDPAAPVRLIRNLGGFVVARLPVPLTVSLQQHAPTYGPRWARWPSAAVVKADLLRRGLVLTGTRQERAPT